MIIPNFYDELDVVDTDSLPLPPLSDEEDESQALDDQSFCQNAGKEHLHLSRGTFQQ